MVDSRVVERFWKKVVKSEGCWLWNGGVYDAADEPTYGSFQGKNAHRFSWELHNGTIPPGLFVLHKCDVKPCVRPDHLYLGTRKDNARDFNERGTRKTNTRILQSLKREQAFQIYERRERPIFHAIPRQESYIHDQDDYLSDLINLIEGA